MQFKHPYIVLALACGSWVTAAPANECNPVNAVYAILKGPLHTQASSVCLSFLGGDKTVQQTQTRTVTGPGVTVTVTAAAQTQTTSTETTNINTITRTATEQLPDVVVTETVTAVKNPRTIYQKREATAVRKTLPAPLAVFASSRISSACRCIVTPTTRTVTTIQTQSVAGPQVVQTQEGGTVTVTVTTTVQVTSENTITTTIPPSTTVTQTLTTTVTPVVIRPKVCNVRGLPGPNAFNYSANFNTDQASCIASCKADVRCLSTGFYEVNNPSTGATTGTCRSYDKPVTDSASLGAGYYTFYDKAC